MTDPLYKRHGDAHIPRYDYWTIFYDAVEAPEGAKLFGPPPRNLRKWIKRARFKANGHEAKVTLATGRRWGIGTLTTGNPVREISVQSDDGLSETMRVSPVDRETFRDRRVLMVMSKNNALEWIGDWAQFYSRAHGVDGVLLYDNASSNYNAGDVLERLRGVEGIKAAIVVPWDFPFGPHGTVPQADGSNYSQVNSYRHGRYRFLSTAAGAINADIDELIVSRDGRSAFDILAESASPALLAEGRWIEAWPRREELPRFTHFSQYDPDRRPPRPKWVADFRRLPDDVTMGEHKIVGGAQHLGGPAAELELLHFRGLNTGWKQNRSGERIRTGRLQEHELAQAVHRILGAEHGTQQGGSRPRQERAATGGPVVPPAAHPAGPAGQPTRSPEDRWSAVDAYIADRLLSSADPVYEAALQANAAAGLPAIDVSPAQGRFLHLLVRIAGARRVLEIGTLGGYSTIWMANALPADGRLITLELSEKHAQVARDNLARAGMAERVDVRQGAALDLLPGIEGPFDLIFIDADKPSNPGYLDWAVRLSRPGTVIVLDNVVRDGRVVDAASDDRNVRGSRAAFDFLHDHPRLDSTALQTVGLKGYDGFAIAVVKAP